jgi:hypothetical protein
MTFFQTIIVWTLRALVIFAAIEFGGGAYAHFSTQFMSLNELQAHAAALNRLEAQARTAEEQAGAAEAQLALVAPPIQIESATTESGAALLMQEMRTVLIEAGATAATFEPNLSAAGGGRLPIATRWQEGADSAPSALYALGRRFPSLRIASLSMHCVSDQGTVRIEANFEANIRTQGQAQ